MNKIIYLSLSLLALPLMIGCSTLTEMGADPEISAADNQLALDVINRLEQDNITRKVTIGVVARDGVVTLHGGPPNKQVRAMAVNIAKNTPGVTEVVDKMLIQR